MPTKEKHVVTFNKGLNTDVEEKLQPEGTYRYALNATSESSQGDQGSKLNAPGNELCASLPAGHTLIGSVLLDDSTFAIFYTNEVDSIIGIYNPKDCTITEKVNTRCLNFTNKTPIHAIYKIHKGCERVVYFTDNNNPYRYVNLDSLEKFKNAAGGWDCEAFRVSRLTVLFPRIDFSRLLSAGGSLEVGAYQFAIRYLDEDLNPTNWYYITEPIPVADEPYNGDYHQIDGGVNSDDTSIPGYVPPTNKSIELSLSNLDKTFEFYQIAILHSTAGNSEVSEVYIDSPISIVADTQLYTYTGNSTSLTTSALADITVSKIPIEKVETHTQLDGRLFLGNIRDDDYDWAEVQRAANLITASYETRTIENDVISEDAPKSATYYLQRRSHMRDEVYAFGIQGVFKNSSTTPAFHIPGREAILSGDPLIAIGNSNTHNRNQVPGGIDWDLQTLTVADPVVSPDTQVALEDVKHLGFTTVTDDPFGLGSGLVHRWKVHNTAIQEFNSGVGVTNGQMAYYECNQSYPDIRDCNGDLIYPNNGTITDKVRHHKFPDTTLEPFIIDISGAPLDEVTLITLGINFDLSQFLTNVPVELLSAVDHWRIVRVDRDDSNKTILDKGYVSETENWNSQSNPTSNVLYNDVVWYSSPSVYFNSNFIGGDHIKFEARMRSLKMPDQTTIYVGNNTPSGLADHAPNTFTWWSYARPGSPPEDFTNRQIASSIFIDRADPFLPAGILNGSPNIWDTHASRTIGNQHYNIRRYNIVTLDSIPTPSGISYPPYQDGAMDYYVSIKRSNFDAYADVTNLTYHPITRDDKFDPIPSNTPIFGGDVFITRFQFEKRYAQRPDTEHPDYPGYSMIATGGSLIDGWYESDINAEYRHSGAPQLKDYFKLTVNTFEPTAVIDALQQHFLVPDLQLPNSGGPNPDDYEDFYGYNLDYSKKNTEIVAIPLPITYDYCTECQNLYPYRIMYSERSFQEQSVDNYRQFLPNNYRDLIGASGEIRHLFVERDDLYCLTDKAIWAIPTRPQTLTTNEDNIFVGTGDILSIPPKRLVSTEYGYGGIKDKFSFVQTEYGSAWVDTNSGAVFHLTDKLNEISSLGKRYFFKDNIPLKLDAQQTGLGNPTYPIISTTHPYGIGYRTSYNPLTKHLIFHKRDYTPLDGVNTIFDDANCIWTNNAVQVDFEDPAYFENHSWTISFFLPRNYWDSFHSFLPSMMFNDEATFYSTILAENIWKHNNESAHQTYYGTKYPFMIDFVINNNPLQTKTLSSLEITSTTTINDIFSTTVTFGEGIFYNDYQSTDQLSLIKKLDPFVSVTNPNSVYIENVENNWRFTGFRDLVTDYNQHIWTSDWTDISSQFPIDRIPNPLSFPTTKSLFDQHRLRDRWFGTRLIFDEGANYKLNLNSVVATTSISSR